MRKKYYKLILLANIDGEILNKILAKFNNSKKR